MHHTLNTEEETLVACYGPTEQWERHFPVDGIGLYYWLHATSTRQRRAEVVMIVRRPDGRLLLHTKTHHPAGVYRLPTGGVQRGDSVLGTLEREQWEELGARLPVVAMPGLVRYEFRFEKWAIPFTSYLFLLRADEALLPHPQDPGEAISGFRWVEPGEIQAVAEQLRGVAHHWLGWGPFRAVPHELFDELQQNIEYAPRLGRAS